MSNVLMLSAIAMLVLLFFKVPVFIAVLGGSMVYFVMNPGINTVIFAQQAIIGTEKISLMAIPFFVCAGIFMNCFYRSGAARRTPSGAATISPAPDHHFDVGFVRTEPDNFFIFAAPMRFCCAAHIDCLQDICLSLGIISIKNVRPFMKINM